MAQGYINERTTDYHSLKSRLMGHGISQQRSDHFDVLNHHLRRGLVAPGQLVIVPDAYSVTCSREEAWLVRHAEAIRLELDNGDGEVGHQCWGGLCGRRTGRRVSPCRL